MYLCKIHSGVCTRLHLAGWMCAQLTMGQMAGGKKDVRVHSIVCRRSEREVRVRQQSS